MMSKRQQMHDLMMQAVAAKLVGDVVRGAEIDLEMKQVQSRMGQRELMDFFMEQARDIAEAAKVVQNTEQSWSDEQWRDISKSIERIEEMTEPGSAFDKRNT